MAMQKFPLPLKSPIASRTYHLAGLLLRGCGAAATAVDAGARLRYFFRHHRPIRMEEDVRQ